MKNSTMKYLRTTVLAALVTLAASQAFAARPFLADDAETSKPGKGLLEVKGAFIADKQGIDGITVERSANEFEGKLAVGVVNNLEAALIVGGVANERTTVASFFTITDNSDGFKDLAIELKYKAIDNNGLKVAIKPTIIVPTGTASKGFSDGRLGYGGTLIASKNIGHLTLLANASYLYHDYRDIVMKDEKRAEIWSGAIGAEMEVCHNVKLVADASINNNTEKSNDIVPNQEVQSYLLVGAEYEIGHHFALFGAGKFGLTKVSEDVTALYGFSVKF